MSFVQGTFGAGGNVDFNLNIVGTEETQKELNNIIVQAELAERLLVQTLSLVRKLSGNEDLNQFIQVIQKTIMVVNQLRIASNLLMASSPWLWALGIIGIVGTVASVTDYAGAYA